MRLQKDFRFATVDGLPPSQANNSPLSVPLDLPAAAVLPPPQVTPAAQQPQKRLRGVNVGTVVVSRFCCCVSRENICAGNVSVVPSLRTQASG